MAEVVGLVRGYWRDLQEWFQDTSMIHFPYKFINPKTKKEETRFLRVAVRPIIPVELVVPKPAVNSLLGMVCPKGNHDYIRDRNKKSKIAFEMMRKSIGLDKLPNDWAEYPHIITNLLKQHAVAFHPIGTKEDGELTAGGEAL